MGVASYSITGYYTKDGGLLCIPCSKKAEHVRRVSDPIFAGDETDTEIFCGDCDNEIQTVVIC